MTLDRAEAAHVATATVAILNDGRYTAPDGLQVEIAGAIAAAVAGTVAYPPEAPLPAVAPGHQTTEFTVRNETTLFPYTTLFRLIGRASCRERV